MHLQNSRGGVAEVPSNDEELSVTIGLKTETARRTQSGSCGRD